MRIAHDMKHLPLEPLAIFMQQRAAVWMGSSFRWVSKTREEHFSAWIPCPDSHSRQNRSPCLRAGVGGFAFGVVRLGAGGGAPSPAVAAT